MSVADDVVVVDLEETQTEETVIPKRLMLLATVFSILVGFLIAGLLLEGLLMLLQGFWLAFFALVGMAIFTYSKAKQMPSWIPEKWYQ